jgi:hypothetical protein
MRKDPVGILAGVGAALVSLALLGCRSAEPPPSAAIAPKIASVAVEQRPSRPKAEAKIRAKKTRAAPRNFDADFVRAFTQLSAEDEPFKGDNLVTNEGSYLDVAPELSRLSGGVYIGVGPEQNFSYIALSRPELAVIVDIRRDNALLHLLYKVLFEAASDRTDFLCRLTMRTCSPASAPGPEAPVESILAYVNAAPRDLPSFSARHRALVDSLRARDGLGLTRSDFATLSRFHREFQLRGLNLRFDAGKRLKASHPTLEKLLGARSADGKSGSFLESEQSFQFVRELHRSDRIWFVTGDFGKPDVLPRLARELRQRSLVVRTFYASNVEQYLFGTSAWRVWQQNLEKFPVDETSLLSRSYLMDQPRHPLQRPGQRVTSFTSPFSGWLRCERRAPSTGYLAAVSRDDCGSVRPVSLVRSHVPG